MSPNAGEATADPAALPLASDAAGRWSAIAGVVLTLAMLLALVRALWGDGLAGLGEALPRDPLFYVASIALYLSLPIGDYVIFRRLWHIPAEGFVALLKKRIANEVVLGYAGEAYFYAWARAHARRVEAPFGAVKDVSILSAMAGNATTLLLVLMALPFAYARLPADQAATIAWSVLAVIGITAPFLIFARRVFSLPARSLWWIFGVHGLRLAAGTVLMALVWHFGRPDVTIGTWLLLSAGRMLTSRLPLVPNKDLLFANFAVLFIGQEAGLSSLVAVTAGFTLLLHLGLIGVFGVTSLLRKLR